jgi:hypothetical protein
VKLDDRAPDSVLVDARGDDFPDPLLAIVKQEQRSPLR